jgi:pyroglutamyl-peptidase
MQRIHCSVLLTGFEPFGDLRRNPSGDIARRLGRDESLRRLGLRVAILPVHRWRAPRQLLGLLERWRPATLLMLGVAAGRPGISVERLAVNCYRRPGDCGVGRRIHADAADGLFATLPLEPALRRLSARGAPASISESAGTFTCNLALFTALEWSSRAAERAPGRIGFIHVPATPESLAPGDRRPTRSAESLARAVGRLVRAEAASR